MKKAALIITGLFVSLSAFPQATGKIQLKNGQKILVSGTMSVEADLGMGMQMTSSSTSENSLEVKNSSDKDYTITSTLTKLKMDLNMAGQSSSYDSEKNPNPTSDMDKSLAEQLNKPVDVILDNTTGKASLKEKPKKTDEEDSNPMAGMMGAFAQSTDDAVVSGAFELVPPGKKVGDSWTDSTKEKDMTTVRTYTLKSLSGNDAVIQVDAVINASNKLEFQGMEMEFKSTTKSSSEITTDINTGNVRSKNTKSDITGNIQIMGQEMPVTAKVNTANTYK
ncbi:MAG TPA: DUF6263 family protein [Ferruginibacter sp.]|nr:DUF6263 family protein [Ferruginibacter sp.]